MESYLIIIALGMSAPLVQASPVAAPAAVEVRAVMSGATETDGIDTLRNDDGTLKLYFRSANYWLARLTPAGRCTLKNIITYKYATDTLGRVAGCSLFVFSDSTASGHSRPGHIVYQAYVRDSLTRPYNVLISNHRLTGSLLLGPADFWAGFKSVPLSTSTPPYKDTLFALSDSYSSGIWRNCYSTNRSSWTEMGYDFLVRAVVSDAPALSEAGVTAITAPVGYVPVGAIITPTALVRNNGATSMSLSAVFTMRSVARDSEFYRYSSLIDNLAAGEERSVAFPVWLVPGPVGSYSARCSLAVNDKNRANDTLTSPFTVTSAASSWTSLTPMPDLPSSKQIREGGWLTIDNNIVYAAKGNKTPDFYSYNPARRLWQTLAQLPSADRPPYKGATGCSDGQGTIYATRGNNTQDFMAYNVEHDSWYSLSPVPLGFTNKKVKGGTDMVYVPGDTSPDVVYLLKGYKNEFWRYSPDGDSWTSLEPAPLGPSGKNKYEKGSFLVYDGNQTVYAHKAKRNELFAFDMNRSAWRTEALQGMPFIEKVGRFTRSKDGGSADWFNGALYAVKGGNTLEFWRYMVGADSWQQLDDMPLIGTSGRKKKVKGGAGVVASPASAGLFVTKGNKTNELWFYSPRSLDGKDHPRSGAASPALVSGYSLSLSPSLLRTGTILLRLSGPLEQRLGMLHIRVLDAAGRTLRSGVVQWQPELSISLDGLGSGVYLVEVRSDRFAVRQKLVVRR